MATAVYGLTNSREQTEEIVDQLKSAGFSNNDISVLFADKSGSKEFAREHETNAPEGATAGAVTGALGGGVLGWLVGIGSLAIPGIGPFVAAGPIMAALGGAAIGGAAGGVVGALVGMGIPEERAKYYDERIRQGNAFIAVQSDNMDEVARARTILEQYGAQDVSTTGPSTTAGSTGSYGRI